MELLLKPSPVDFEPSARETIAPSLSQLVAGLEIEIPGIAAHLRRVARYAAGLSRQLDLSHRQVARIRRAAGVHDIGKLEMPTGIVNKPAPLSPEEFEIVKRHAIAGARIVLRRGHGDLAPLVRHHHERFDGRGYPDGLAGEEIPLGARIIAVADTFDAATSDRPYRAALGHREALELLRAEAGGQLDPGVVAAFCEYYSGLRVVLLRAFAR